MSNIWQCGYSRLGKQGEAAGWQSITLGEGIPADALDKYAKIQSQNVAAQVVLDGSGEPLRLFEVVGDGQYVFMSWIQYGLDDDMGRKNNMFAHAVVLSLLDEAVYKDPGTFLAIGKDNFAKSYEEALSASRELRYDDPMTIDQALEICAIDRDRWTELLFAVFSAMEQKKPLYVITEEDERVWKAALLCIYLGLPFGVRKNLSAASYLVNPGNNRTVVFSKDYKPSDLFFELKTGNNNVLTERAVRKYKRWGFIDFAASMDDLSQSRAYYEELDKTAQLLGDSQGAKTRYLRVAHQMILSDPSEITDEEDLNYRLFGALQAGIEGNEHMERYICGLLHQVNLGDVVLSDASDEELMRFLQKTGNEELRKEGVQYSVHVMMRQPPEAGRDRLASFPAGAFREYAEELNKEPRGQQILDLYYVDRIRGAASLEALEQILEEKKAYQGLVQADGAMETRAFELYRLELVSGSMPLTALDRYLGFMSKILPAESLSDVETSAKGAYWENQYIDAFQYDMAAEYRAFLLPSNQKAVCFNALLDAREGVRRDVWNEFQVEMDKFYENLEGPFAWETRGRILQECIASCQSIETDLITNWREMIDLAFLAGWTNLGNEAMALRDAVQNHDWQSFQTTYTNRTAQIPGEARPFEVMEKYNSLLRNVVMKYGLQGEMTVDMWLLMGSQMYENAFEVFDYMDWPVDDLLDAEPEDVVAGSACLTDPVYQDLAHRYIKANGQCKDVVKEWMSECRKLEKGKKRLSLRRRSAGDTAARAGGTTSEPAAASYNTEEPAASYQPGAPAPPDKPADPAGAYRPADPAGAYRPEDPAGAYQPRVPVSPSLSEDPAGAYRPADPAGAYRPADPASTYQPRVPVSPGRPEDPTGAYRPADPAGAYRPEDPAGAYRPENPPAPNTPGNVGEPKEQNKGLRGLFRRK